MSYNVRKMIDLLESQVNNGGFNQFFFNSSGDQTFNVLESLKAISAMATHGIMLRAIGKFPNGVVPGDHAIRQSVLESIDPETDAFEEQDESFYRYEDNLSKLVADYELRG